MTMAERGFVTLAFDPSFTGESGGEPRFVNSPDINTDDFSSAVKVCANSKAKYELIKNKLYFMITSDNPKAITEDFEKANAVIKQIIEESKDWRDWGRKGLRATEQKSNRELGVRN